MRHAFYAMLLVVSACAPAGDDLIEPELTPGKADVGDRVVLRGPLALGGEVSGAFAEDLQFDAYTIDVRPGARVDLDVTQRGSSRNLDTTLFVYGPATSAGYGTSALATDDNAGWGRLSRLRDLRLADGGRYLVVVGTRDARGRGNYRLTAACASGACAPVADDSCPSAIANDIRACVAALQVDHDGSLDPTEAVRLCIETELGIADVPELAAACTRQLLDEVLDRSCVLGTTYQALFTSAALVVTHARKLTSVSGLSATARAQVVSAVQASSHTDVTTAAEALARVDEQEINVTELWDASARRAFTAYEYGAGDNSYGRVFVQGTTTKVADIHDGDLTGCTATWGPERRDCSSDADCAAGLRCTGIVAERGTCIDPRPAAHAAEGDTCRAPTLCPIGAGLVCAGLTRGDEGMCQPAWMHRRFASAPAAAIPDAHGTGVESQLLVHGLATVDTDVRLTVTLDHPAVHQVRMVLRNPAGTEVVVFDGATAGVSEVWDLSLPVRGFPGDESVNGRWTLHATDGTSGEAGQLTSWALDLGSRWD
jgi:subtilisin-like proprotein convertase family protein